MRLVACGFDVGATGKVAGPLVLRAFGLVVGFGIAGAVAVAVAVDVCFAGCVDLGCWMAACGVWVGCVGLAGTAFRAELWTGVGWETCLDCTVLGVACLGAALAAGAIISVGGSSVADVFCLESAAFSSLATTS